MRPHRLRVQAFGAFAGIEQVIFDDLDGLFLLHGETGAGKTTLLDAIAFALYGRVPGERGNAKRLRSDHAAPGLSTEVELEATIGGRRLRITRKPEQERPKRSGTGATREPASVRLDERSACGSWESKSTRVAEADQEIKDLMGMSAEQFFQVVLLPQGQFAQFLQAKAQDKEALLQKLFGTDRFRAVERWLADRRLATEKEAAAASDALTLLVAQVAQAAGVPVADPELMPDPKLMPNPALMPDAATGADGGSAAASGPWQATWVAGLAAQAAATRDQAAILVAARDQDLERALAAKSEAEQLAGRQRRRRDALRRQRDLLDAAPAIAALRSEADAALRAAEVKADLDAADRAATVAVAAREARSRSGALLASLPMARAAGLSPDTPAGPLHEAAEEQRTSLGRLDALRAVARQAADEDKNAMTAQARAAAIDAGLTVADADRARAEEARPEAIAARDAASQAAAELPAAQAAADTAARAAADAAALVTQRTTRDRRRQAHLAAREKAVESRMAALGIREARIDGMRAELAATMTDNSPCPVCGSRDHPDPVESTFAPVGRDAEDAANALADQAAAAADKAGREVTAAETRISELAQRLAEAGFLVLDLSRAQGSAVSPSAVSPSSALASPAPSPAEPLAAALRADPAALAAAASRAAADAKRLETEAARLAALAAALPRLQRALDELDEAMARGNARRVELGEQRKAAEAEAAAATRRAADRRTELAAQLGDAVDLDAAITAARALSEALSAAAEAADETARTAAEDRAAADRAAQAATQAGFPGATAAIPQPARAPAPASAAAPARQLAQDPAARPSQDPSAQPAAPAVAAPAVAAVAAARAALRGPRWRGEAAGRIGQHDTETAAVAAQLADRDLAIELDPPAPVAESAAAAAAAQRAHGTATSAHATASYAADQLGQLEPKITSALAALDPIRERADRIRQVADLANGNGANQYRMTLSSFVLAARLEEVAAAASERLRTMTAGRYSLAHSDARKGNSRAGLSLLACDSWTGIDRDTATLSGGETFLASLSLALGLADVVTAEAAGTPMEALFVDEGFGTLDEDTLDEVMNVLDGLREGGRIVGIVSHVAELRQRVPSRIHVAKGRHGSHVTIAAG